MAKKVRRQDLFEENLFTTAIKQAQEYDVVLKKIIKTQKKNLEESRKFIKTFSGKSFQDVKKFNGTIKETDSRVKALNAAEKERARIKQRLIQLSTDEGKKNELLKLRLSEQRKQTKALAKDKLGLVSAYQKESRRLNDLRNKYKHVAITQGENSKQARRLRAEVTKLDAKLKRVDASVGQFQRNVGNYSSAFRGLGNVLRSTLSAFGVVGGISIFVRGMREAFNTVRSFQKENAVLAGVLNTTRSEIKALTTDAKRLGATTAKTATDVNKLQVAYARLGFSQQEILNLTEPTINGSIALNAELERTATLTGAVVRTFDDFSSIDAPEILDVMTAATQQSALNFEKLETSIPIVAGAANTAGIPFNRLIALLGKLSDSGIDASMSSTALRNIFIESAKQGLDYEEILTKIVNSQDQLTAANDEFGKRAAVSASILSKNIDATNELEEALNNAGGTAERVAAEQLDTLDGKIQLVTSAYQGFILSLADGDGVFTRIFNGFIDRVTHLLDQMTLLNKTAEDFGDEALGDINKEITKLIGSATDSSEATKILNDELQTSRVQLGRLQRQAEEAEGMFDFLDPAAIARNKAMEQLIGQAEKRIEVLQKALENPENFIESQQAVVDEKEKEKELSEETQNITKENIELLQTREERAKAYREEIEITIEAMKTAGIITDEARKEDEKYQAQLEKRHQKTLEQEEEQRIAQEQRIERNRRIREELIEGATTVTDRTFEELDKRTSRQQAALDEELRMRDQNIEHQRRLAEQGLDNQLAFEQQQRAEAELEKERLAEKQIRREKVKYFYSLAQSYAESGEAGASAAKAAAQVAIAEVIAGFFAEGTERVGDNSAPKWRSTGTDDFVVAVDKDERILSADQNRMIGYDMPNDMVAQIAHDYNEGLLRYSRPVVTTTFRDDRIVSELKGLRQDSVRQQPAIRADHLGNIIETRVNRGMKKTVKHINRRPRL